MKVNLIMYKNYAKKRIDPEWFVEYEKDIDLSFSKNIRPCAGYEEMKLYDNIQYNSYQHNLLLISHQDGLQKYVGRVGSPEVLSVSSDTRQRVDLMRDNTIASSTRGIDNEQCFRCQKYYFGDHVCTDFVKEVNLEVFSPRQYTQTNVVDLTSNVPIDYSCTIVTTKVEATGHIETNGDGYVIAPLVESFAHYPVENNTIRDGGLKEDQIVKIIDTGSIIVRNREFSAFLVKNARFETPLRLSPGRNQFLPSLSRIASNYKYYRILGMVIDYVPLTNYQGACVEMASFRPAKGRLKLVDHKTRQRMRLNEHWVHLVECEPLYYGQGNLVYDINIDTQPVIYSYLIEGHHAKGTKYGEIWISYEVELWGDANLSSESDGLHTQLRILPQLLGPEFGLLRFFFSPVSVKKRQRILVQWVDSKGGSVVDSGVEDLHIKIFDDRFNGFEFYVPREGIYSVRDMVIRALAVIAANWRFVGDYVYNRVLEVEEVEREIYSQIINANRSYSYIRLEMGDQLSRKGYNPYRVENYLAKGERKSIFDDTDSSENLIEQVSEVGGIDPG